VVVFYRCISHLCIESSRGRSFSLVANRLHAHLFEQRNKSIDLVVAVAGVEHGGSGNGRSGS
jgi:hypothetical protein